MSVRAKIQAFIEDLRSEHALFPYVYNAAPFDPDKDWVYYAGPVWDTEEVAAAMESLLTGRWLAAGEKVAQFENQFSRQFGFSASLMVNSGSSANLVMIAALKRLFQWKDADEVVVSSVGFPTTVAAVVQNGLKPSFVDIRMDDLNFDLDLLQQKLSAKTRAIFLSPILGNPPDMDRLQELAKRHNILLVLDGCDSLGSRWRNKPLSDYVLATTCSFYPAHHITTGEGGMVSSFDAELVAVARRLAWWGRDCYCIGAANLLPEGTCRKRMANWLDGYDGIIDHKYLFSEIGYNLKPLDLQGAVGSVQLRKLDWIHERRRANKARFQTLFERHIDGVRVCVEHSAAQTSWFGVPVVCRNRELKDALVRHLEANRIQTRNCFAGNILLHPGYRHLDSYAAYPQANRVLAEVFFVGCHPAYDDTTFSYVETVLRKFEQPLSPSVVAEPPRRPQA